MADQTARVLRDSFKGAIPRREQVGPHHTRLVGVSCYIGVTLDISELINRLGEKALKSKGRRATAFHGALILQVKEIGDG